MNTLKQPIVLPVIAALLTLALLPSLLSATPAPGKKLFLEASVNLMLPADDSYREIYSASILFPDFRGGIYLSRSIFLFAGYGFLSMDGITPLWQLDTRMKQSVIMAGAGWTTALSKRLDLTASAGASLLHYKEEIPELDVSNSDDCLGFVLELALGYKLSESLELRLGIGYLHARESETENPYSLGGLKTRLGLAFRF